ncbi:hypothetical protein QVD17_13470 [Tagetes erecta]|uniref:Uncharacterized protein n=1 Tax=Tagetes erecta TaxID=13708 RepID=A0AAD8P249_TARER|nr:hypothetical protein QVD17_13470 [Tagetes erecta]
MNANQKFEQIWGFRRNVDSSSEESKSKSVVGKGQEKLSLVPSLVSPENDHVSETENRQVQDEKKPKRTRNVPKKENKNKKEVKSKPKKDSCASSDIKKGGNNIRKKKSKFISQMTVSDDFRIFTESILDDLRVARESMFAKMRKEMDQLVSSKPRSRSKNQKGSGSNVARKPNPKPRARKPTKAKPKTELPDSKGLDHPQEHIKKENPKDTSSKNPILIDPCPKKPIFTNAPNQPITSSYLTLPLVSSSDKKNPVLIDPCAKKPIFTNAPDQIVTSSYLTLPVVLSNDTSLKLERGNYSQGEERFRSYVHNNAEPSCVGNGYPVGLNHHQRFDNSSSFGIPSRAVQEFAHEGSLLGTRVVNGGGLRYNAGLSGHSIPNHLGSSGFRGGLKKVVVVVIIVGCDKLGYDEVMLIQLLCTVSVANLMKCRSIPSTTLQPQCNMMWTPIHNMIVEYFKP